MDVSNRRKTPYIQEFLIKLYTLKNVSFQTIYPFMMLLLTRECLKKTTSQCYFNACFSYIWKLCHSKRNKVVLFMHFPLTI